MATIQATAAVLLLCALAAMAMGVSDWLGIHPAVGLLAAVCVVTMAMALWGKLRPKRI